MKMMMKLMKKMMMMKMTKMTKKNFAQIFRGGPNRRESDLPVVEEEEGVELEVEVPQDAADDSGLAWLTSLGDEDAAEVEAEEKLKEELGWLSSIKPEKKGERRAPEVVTGYVAKPSAAAAAYKGKALPIPPFWRMAERKDIERRFRYERPDLLQRWKRMSKDAQRSEKRRGKLRVGVIRAH